MTRLRTAIGTLSEFGTLGLVRSGDTPHRARALSKRAVAVQDAETDADGAPA